MHVLHEPGSPYRETIRDYYRYLDEEIGQRAGTADRRHDRPGRLRPRRAAARRRVLRQRMAGPRGPARAATRYPEQVTPFAKLDVELGAGPASGARGAIMPASSSTSRDASREASIAPADYERFRDEVKARLEATTDARRPAARDAGLQARGGLPRGPQRRPRPDRPLRRPVLAVDRRRRLSDAPRPGERHRARRLQPCPARGVHPRLPRTTRSRASRGAAHLLDIAPTLAGTGRLRRPRVDARPVARGRSGRRIRPSGETTHPMPNRSYVND